MNTRLSTILWVLVLTAAAFGLYLVKYEVQGIQDELKSTLTQLEEERENIRVLKAEWQYLNRPERIEALAGKYLKLEPLTASQIAEVSALPIMADTPATAPDNVIPASVTGAPDAR